MYKFFTDTTFISSLVGAGFGAGFAFYLNNKKEEEKKTQEEVSYLTYTVYILSNIVSELYEFKRIYKSKEDDLNYLYSAMNFIQSNQTNLKLDKPFKFLANIIQSTELSFPINIEKLNFIHDLKPGIISLLFATEKSIKTHNVILEQLNKFLLENFHNKEENHSQLTFGKLANFTKNWGAEIDLGLYLVETLQDALIEYGKIKYKGEFKVSNAIVAEEYKSLKPPVVESWEFIKVWKKKSCIDKYFPTFKKLFNQIKKDKKQ